MNIFKLKDLTQEKVNQYFENNGGMDIITKTGTKYHIIKTPKGKYYCYSWYCMNIRKMTNEMKKVFC